MSTQYVEYPAVPASRGFSWSGIFAGTFLFLAIEATFGILGVAIFATAANPPARNPITPGIGVGIGIWMVILSIIALYFAGKLASKLSGAVTRNIGMYAGLVTFGMCIFATALVGALMLGSPIGGAGNMSYIGASHVTNYLIAAGYWLFLALVLSMIAAASGGIHGAWASERRQPPLERPAEPRRVA